MVVVSCSSNGVEDLWLLLSIYLPGMTPANISIFFWNTKSSTERTVAALVEIYASTNHRRADGRVGAAVLSP